MKKNKTGIYLIYFLSFVPIVIWIASPVSVPRFDTFSHLMTALGQASALVGTMFFSLNFILATKWRILEKIFSGLNEVYNKHSYFGQLGFILLLVHPLLLLSKYATSLAEAGRFLWLSSNWAQNWGIFALYSMIILIVLTLYLRPKYNLWKITHKFFGLALFLGILHVWLIPSVLSQLLILKIYMLGFAGLGFVGFLYRVIFEKWLVKTYEYAVTEIIEKNTEITEIRMKSKSKKLNFLPGQFIFIGFRSAGITKEVHPFSISSSPKDDFLSITVKNLGDYTINIDKLSVGDVAFIEGPFGVFTLENATNRDQIWIAGGIGVTPFISLVRSDIKNKKIDFYYAVRNKREAIYLDELKKVAKQSNSLFKIRPFYSDKQGYLSARYIQEQLGDISKKDILICAPPGMINALKDQFKSLGISNSSIFSEEFSF